VISYCKGHEEIRLLHLSLTNKVEEQAVEATPVKHVLTSLVVDKEGMISAEEEAK
jgi:hypothetical protein